MTRVLRLRAWRSGPHRGSAMNKLEARYVAEVLGPAQLAGEIAAYYFEAIKLEIGKRCWYLPDFLVIRSDGTLELHEVKGFWEDDARVKIKAVAAKYPFRFVAAQRKRGQWTCEEI